MVQLIYPIILTVALLIRSSDQRAPTPGTLYGDFEGGSTNFWIGEDAPNKKTISGIRIYSGERINQVGLFFNKKATPEMSGGKGGKSTDLILEDGEFIKSVQVSPIKLPSQGRFRISYIKFVTNKGRFLEGGKKTQSGRILAGGTDGPHHGQKLVGFAGRRGAEVDAFYAIWGNVY